MNNNLSPEKKTAGTPKLMLWGSMGFVVPFLNFFRGPFSGSSLVSFLGCSTLTQPFLELLSRLFSSPSRSANPRCSMKTYTYIYHINSSYIINVGKYGCHIECLVIGGMQKKHGDLWFRRNIRCCQACLLWLRRWRTVGWRRRDPYYFFPSAFKSMQWGHIRIVTPQQKLTWHTNHENTTIFVDVFSAIQNGGDFPHCHVFLEGGYLDLN